ncbi:MAG: ATP-binding protein [Polyangiaceae bacterium]|nr:ATP-binding protein [Polyangiaceae bacterium]
MRELSIGRAAPLEGVPGAPASHTPIALPTHHLVTHGVILGMTGSGKTGLSIVMIEEALRAGVPVLAVDIKGDLPNLLLTFPELDGPSFAPWVDPEAAARAGRSVDELASETATRWRAQLATWGLGPEQVRALREGTAARLVTPGASIGEPLDVLSSLSTRSPLWDDDPEAAHDQLSSAISLVLRLAGADGDPRSREHVVLSTLALRRLEAERSARLEELLNDLLEPPIDRVGVMSFEQFLPPRERQALAQRLNALLASPKLGTWLKGAPLDVKAWLEPPRAGATPARTPLTLFSVAHLDDEERQLVLGLLLDELVAYVRGLSGTSSLRALVVFDEVFGFLPPHPANPPTKKPLLTLMKQARAFGVGVVLATQNPMDLDYKALSNAGVWMVGRLQTDADRERVVEGLSGSDGGLAGLEPAALASILKALPGRTFFTRDVHQRPSCTLIEVRGAMSWLRGPMTRRELTRLSRALGSAPPAQVAPVSPGDAAQPPSGSTPSGTVVRVAPSTQAQTRALSSGPPAPPAGWESCFLRSPSPAALLAPQIAATVVIHVSDPKLSLTLSRRATLLAPLDAAGKLERGAAVFVDPSVLSGEAPPGKSFAPLPRELSTKRGVQAVERAVRDHVAVSYGLVVDVHRGLKLWRQEAEPREAFAARCAAEAERRAREEHVKLDAKWSARFAKLGAKAEGRDRALAHAHHAATSAPSDLGAALVGLALGRRAGGKLSRARDRAEAGQQRAAEAAFKARGELAQAQAERDAELRALYEAAGRQASAIESIRMLPKKTDLDVAQLAIVWAPAGA